MGKWSGREDSNLRPLGPKPSALPGCATPRLVRYCGKRLAILASVLSCGQASQEFVCAGQRLGPMTNPIFQFRL